MNKIIVIALLGFLFCVPAFAGELRTTPEYMVLNDPTTNQVEFLTLTHFYSAAGPYAVIMVQVLDSTGVRSRHPTYIRNIPDNAESIAVNCIEGDNPATPDIDESRPWPLCTGAGTCANGPLGGECDETDPVYSDFVDGYGATMKSRGDSLVWQNLQTIYDTQATP